MIDYINFIGSNGSSITLDDDTYPMTLYDSQVETVTEERARPSQHGLFPTYTYMGKRTFHMEGDIFGSDTTDFINKRIALMAPFVPVPEYGFKAVGTLVVRYTGLSEAVQSLCFLDGLPAIPLEALSPARGTYAISLQTFDPIMYGSDAIVAKTGLPGGSGGFVFPITFPLSFSLGTGGGGDVQVTNSGNAAVYPTVTIFGPCTTPTLTLRALGSTFQMVLDGLTLAVGEYVVLDFRNRTVTSSTLGSAYNYVQTGSVWWQIPPGTSTVTYTAFSASTGSHAEISYSNGYMV